MTASASASIVTTMPAPRAATAGEPAITTPSSASGSALSCVRFQAVTLSPARAMFRAMAKPMVPPAPGTAMVSDTSTASVTRGYPRYTWVGRIA